MPGVEFSIHICRGNLPDAWMASAATRRSPSRYSDGRRTSTAPARVHQPGGRLVRAVAKLRTTSRSCWGWSRQEPGARAFPSCSSGGIKEAAQYFPLQQLALSSSCGLCQRRMHDRPTSRRSWAWWPAWRTPSGAEPVGRRSGPPPPQSILLNRGFLFAPSSLDMPRAAARTAGTNRRTSARATE